jgi:hypothetical protein
MKGKIIMIHKESRRGNGYFQGTLLECAIKVLKKLMKSLKRDS